MPQQKCLTSSRHDRTQNLWRTGWLCWVPCWSGMHGWSNHRFDVSLWSSKSVYATSHLVCLLWFVAPYLTGGMESNTIKNHLVLDIHEDILNFGVPEVMNSSYAESGHITICKDTTRNTQKQSQTFTVQAALWYEENLAFNCASAASVDSTCGTKSPSGSTYAAKLCGKQLSITRMLMVRRVVIVGTPVKNQKVVSVKPLPSILRPVLTGFDNLQNKPHVKIFPTVCKSNVLRKSWFTKQTTSYSVYDHVENV